MKAPIHYRRFDYDKALIPNKYIASMEQGVSTIEQAIAKTGFTVELNREYYEVALNNFKQAGVSDLIDATNEHSFDFLNDFAKTNIPVRIAFLDASHLFDDVIREFEIILPLLGPQSIVIFDNTYLIAEEHEDQRVHEALREILRRHGGNLINFEIVSWYTPGIAIWQKYPFDSMNISKSGNMEETRC